MSLGTGRRDISSKNCSTNKCSRETAEAWILNGVLYTCMSPVLFLLLLSSFSFSFFFCFDCRFFLGAERQPNLYIFSDHLFPMVKQLFNLCISTFLDHFNFYAFIYFLKILFNNFGDTKMHNEQKYIIHNNNMYIIHNIYIIHNT